MAGVVGLQQLLRMQGLEWGDAALGDKHFWIDGGIAYHDSPLNLPGLVTVVQPSTGLTLGQFSKLTTALAAITDASSTNRYQVWVVGSIVETAEVVLKSNIDIHFLGGSTVTNNNDDTTVTMRCPGQVNINVYDATFIRGGSLTGTNAAICATISGAADDTVRFWRCRWLNRTTKGAGSTNGRGCHGLYQTTTSAARFIDCEAVGGAGDQDCYGLVCDGTSVGFHKGCFFRGGSGGINCYGGAFKVDHAGNYIDCEFTGGDGGDTCHGIYCTDRAEPEVLGGMGKGGQGGNSCFGISIDAAANMKCFGTKIEGGDAGNTAIGLNTAGASTFTGDTCSIAGGRHGQASRAVKTNDSSACFLHSCINAFRRAPSIGPSTYTSAGISGAGAGSFQATQGNSPFSVMAVRITVVTTRANAFVSIGSTAGASDVVAGSATNLPLTGAPGTVLYAAIAATQPIIAAPSAFGTLAGILFATPGGAGAGAVVTGDFTIEVSGIVDYATCETIWIAGTGPVELGACDFNSGRASDCVKIDAVAVTANMMLFTNSKFKAWQASASAKKAVNAASAYSPAPIYQCTLIGGVTNITGGAGTVNGTNIVA